MAASDWRSELQPHDRKMAVQQIVNAVKLYKHLDEDSEQELEKFSQLFENKTFACATSQSDYWQQITLKEDSMKWTVQEEVYQKIVMMKGMYLSELSEIYHKLFNKMQKLDSLRQLAESETYGKLNMFKVMLERIMAFLKVSELDFPFSPDFCRKLPSYEKQILNLLNANRPRKSPIGNNHTSSGAQ